MSKPLSKIKHQIKSGKYYVFWGACTLAVMTGQIYVGAGYRQMSKSLDAWFDKTISIMIQKRMLRQQEIPDRGGYYMPTPKPEDYEMPVIR